jgi:DNA (cytosine-5)-methyltransferase 1
MKKYKILNLYACLGGNRYKWDEVAKEAGIGLEVTAVELDEEAARLYQERFPNDKVVVADAHQYLLDNFKDLHLVLAIVEQDLQGKTQLLQFTQI